MADLFAWFLTIVLCLFFVLGAGANAHIVFIAGRRAREGGHTPSIIPLVPGLLGMAGCLSSPADWLRQWAWVPLILDVGCAPYLLLALIALTVERLRRSSWFETSSSWSWCLPTA